MSDAKLVQRGFREMVKSDLQGGTISILNTAYDATIGTFTRMDVFGSGVSPHLTGDVQVLMADFPAGFKFTLGLDVVVVPNTGSVRQCKLESTQNSGPHINIRLIDKNNAA
jgi:hypothetical protein